MKTLLTVLICLAAFTFGGRAQNIINPNNTVVRFGFLNNGTNYGKVDVELFDQDKPETVRNFLLYVYSGGYSNVFLQRLRPNFILQAGRGKLPNPNSPTRFESYVTVPTYGRITNEYNTGPFYGNEFGTLAMAKISGLASSAENEWFFNLTNNAPLNEQNGGFTVFGHVVNSTDARSGTNFLAYLNTFSRGHGLTNNESPEAIFTDLPVATNRSPYIFYSDLITVQVFVIQNGTPQPGDTLVPSVTITTPSANFQVTTNDSYRLVGTAFDNTAVARVYYESDSLGRFVVDGTTNWSADVKLLGGTNVLTVRSVDWRGNLSLPVKRTIYRTLLQPVSLQVTGSGRVLGLTNGQFLEVGKIYKLTAKPSSGYLFASWGGNISWDNPVVHFLMDTTITNITVTFGQPLARLAKGSYNGIFSPATNGPKNSAGSLKLNLSASGSYSGSLAPLGANYSIRGQFNAAGYSLITGPLGTKTLTLELLIQTNGGNRILGGYSDGTFVSSVELYPAQTFSAGGVTAPQGSYSFLLSPPLDVNSTTVKGFGSGTVTIDSRGRVKMSGTLADGTPISQSTTLLRGLRWPFISNARGGAGAVVGWATFDNATLALNKEFNAEMKWFSPSFPGATNQNLTMAGSSYTRPTVRPLFNWTSGTITFAGVDLGTLTANVTLNADGSFTIPANPHNIQIQLDSATGRITGSFNHPNGNVPTDIQGAVLQNDDQYAAGFYESTTGNGSFQIRRQ